MKNFILTLCLFFSAALYAQIPLGGHIVVPSSSDSATGSSAIVFTSDANCTVLTATNCTVSGGTQGPYLGGYLVSGTISAQRDVITISPATQNRTFNVTNKTTGGFAIRIIETGNTSGLGCGVPNGATIPVVWDGTSYVCASGSTIGLGTIATQNANAVAITGGAATLKSLGTVFQVDGFPSSCVVGGTSYTTQADCAFYTAAAKVVSISNSVDLVFGDAFYSKCAEWIQPNGYPKVNIIGTSMQGTVINQTCNTPTLPMLLDSTGTPTILIRDLTFYAGQMASSCFDLLAGSLAGSIENVTCDIPATTAVSGSDHALQIGSSGSPAQNLTVTNLYVGSAPFSVTPTMAVLVSTGTTSLTGITLTSGGANYDPTYAVGVVNDPHMYCLSDEPTFTVTLTSGVVSGTTITHAGTCSGGLPDLGVVNQYPITYGMKLFTTDSTIINPTVSLGVTAIDMEGSQSVIIHAHPISTVVGIRATNSNTYTGTEFDTVYSSGADLIGNSGQSFVGTTAYTSFGIPPGAVIYRAESGTSNVSFLSSGGLCSTPVPLDYSAFTVVPYGTVTPFEFPQWPANFQVFGYDGTCSFTGQTNQTGNILSDLYTILPSEATYLDFYANVSNLIPYYIHPGVTTLVLDGLDVNDCTVGGGTVVHFCFADTTTFFRWVPYTFPLSSLIPSAAAHAFLAGPLSGSDATPAMRYIDPSDLPDNIKLSINGIISWNNDTSICRGSTDGVVIIGVGSNCSTFGVIQVSSVETSFVTASGVASVTFNQGTGVGVSGYITVRAAVTLGTGTSDTFSITGISSTSICTSTAANSTAANSAIAAYISSVSTNSITLGHAATIANGAIFNVLCSVQ